MAEVRTIPVFDQAGTFGGDKDAAARIRDSELRPALAANSDAEVVLDFKGVDYVTQSFIHALMSAIVRRTPSALDRIRFDNCSEGVREIIEIVIQYSQETYRAPD